MASLRQAISSLILKEFVSAFFLSMRYFFAPKKTLNYPFEKGPLLPAFGASMRCAAIPTVRSAASPASCARRFAPRRQSPSKRTAA
jgi:hypothetical protein